ncbi:BZ3500_MvSof-1268-A1-R1_Chr3-3g06553 [Microbotryum saponariae]|uniref:BZ3500_MvSof-1268-A1-R1_Chr3-3g06553 protein n=1 Tax=Microbotryum saponariae TaxID=289078 RepID=A0A2X0KV57_9BASI|nr:BZ3500_MvSof-1268-A1-R1_Chr3-3g06553 [Microbotryum saponariae]SDA04520.1 BZ3501_MvSof-1269-A2-R1_Chr3-2g06240 [Microbotryum saponariae]
MGPMNMLAVCLSERCYSVPELHETPTRGEAEAEAQPLISRFCLRAISCGAIRAPPRYAVSSASLQLESCQWLRLF